MQHLYLSRAEIGAIVLSLATRYWSVLLPRGYPQVAVVSVAFGLSVVKYSRSFFLKDEGGWKRRRSFCQELRTSAKGVQIVFKVPLQRLCNSRHAEQGMWARLARATLTDVFGARHTDK